MGTRVTFKPQRGSGFEEQDAHARGETEGNADANVTAGKTG